MTTLGMFRFVSLYCLFITMLNHEFTSADFSTYGLSRNGRITTNVTGKSNVTLTWTLKMGSFKTNLQMLVVLYHARIPQPLIRTLEWNEAAGLYEAKSRANHGEYGWKMKAYTRFNSFIGDETEMIVPVNDFKILGVEYEFVVQRILTKSVELISATATLEAVPPKTGIGCFQTTEPYRSGRQVTIFWKRTIGEYEIFGYEKIEKKLVHRNTGFLTTGFVTLTISNNDHFFYIRSLLPDGNLSQAFSYVYVPYPMLLTNPDTFFFVGPPNKNNQREYMLTWNIKTYEWNVLLPFTNCTIFWLDERSEEVLDFVVVPVNSSSVFIKDDGLSGVRLAYSINSDIYISGLRYPGENSNFRIVHCYIDVQSCARENVPNNEWT